MKKLGNVTYAGGKFTDRGGNEKTRWIRCGVLFKTAEGKYKLKMDSFPLGIGSPDEGWFEVFEDKPRPQAADASQAVKEEDLPW